MTAAGNTSSKASSNPITSVSVTNNAIVQGIFDYAAEC
jgi:hypothetical protein